MTKAHDYPDVYEDLGIDLRDLGCLMIDTGNPIPDNMHLDPADGYTSPDPKKFWMHGIHTDWHVTARYGFLPDVRKRHVDQVLDGFELPSELALVGFEVFPSPYADEDYECLVVRVDSPELRALNAHLSILPNINTFVPYKAHITVGYFKRGFYNANRNFLDYNLTVPVLGLNYGHILSKD